MRREFFSRFIGCMVFLGSAILAVASAIAAPVFNLFAEAFPAAAPPLDRSTDTVGTELADRQSQTGKGVWAFLTDLFKVEGRNYCWQGGDVA